MNCKKEWSKEFVNDQFTKVFLREEYRASRETILFEEEKIHLPELQDTARRRKLLYEMEDQLRDLSKRELENEDNDDQFVREQKRTRERLRTQKQHLQKQINELRHQRSVKEKAVFLKKCTVPDCRGFLSKDYVCGLCNTTICKDCHFVRHDDHECKPEDVQTVAEIERSTKPCPTCYIPIQKSDGCDQMFCIKCHTGFSWKTGQIETGIIHNPHYFEALRNGNIQDIRHRAEQGACGPMPTYTRVNEFVKHVDAQTRRALYFYYQQFVHHRQVTLRLFEARDDVEIRHDRIHYLTGHLDEKKYKANLYIRQQKTLRKREEQYIMDSFVTIGEELFRSLTGENTNDIWDQLTTLSRITYDALMTLDKKYQHKAVVRPNSIMVFSAGVGVGFP